MTGHSGFRHGNAKLLHHSAEVISVLREVDGFGACAQNIHTVLLEVAGEIQRSLTAELRNYADGFSLSWIASTSSRVSGSKYSLSEVS